MKIITIGFILISYIINTVQGNNNHYTRVISKNGGGCERYTGLRSASFAIYKLRLLDHVKNIRFYEKTFYADEYKASPGYYYDYILRKVCNSASASTSTDTRTHQIGVVGWHSNNKGNDHPPASKGGCKYIYQKEGSVGINYAVGRMNHVVEYSVCDKISTCVVSATVFNLKDGEERNKPVQHGCVFSMYTPRLATSDFN
ncbi:hypothetical protein AX774_g7109 [Zancudomyces culisetae]|uniref:Uncharacterized protein n=1 Tax=Zancudomyces culisetae TaxID=1213189 RepID=A0A1R1PER7_ZANCU|nr:hypothetical protein AX774_g7109 [Zancudomyces culisetae]|eukprot:OMH79480.1 hypothetical protein AX774_g7109 [Zancudomyces culisetae]